MNAIKDLTVRVQNESLNSSQTPALCVDLDGTLVKSDTLVDALLTLFRRSPICALRCLFFLTRGKASFKAELARHVVLNPATLPYNKSLLDYLRAERAAGRDVYLATAANEAQAEIIAKYLGIFTAVIASKGNTNLRGETKGKVLAAQFSQRGFDYIGDALPDVEVLSQANKAMLANPELGISERLRRQNVKIERIFEDRASRFGTLLQATRVKQWPKNLLIFLPLMAAHMFFRLHELLTTCLAFASWSFVASATYILNDMFDVDSDRNHPVKSSRPFAAGELSLQSGFVVVCVLLMLAAMIALKLPSRFGFWLMTYFLTTLAYSIVLKKVALVDVIVLAGLYTVRMVAGASASDIFFSGWLGGFSIFFFLSLAIVKRYTELDNLRRQQRIPESGRGYRVEDIEQLRSFGTASGYAAVVVFALYIYNNNEVLRMYMHFQRLWLLIPVLIYWINRIWLLAHRGELDEDPVVFALTDYWSALLGVVALLIVLSAI